MNRADAARHTAVDLLKGLACLVILYVHSLSPRVDGLTPWDLAPLTLLFASAPMFFFLSGINVVNFLDRNERDAGFRITWFYLAAAVMLFVLSLCYSVAQASLRLPQIFQGIAMTTAVTFLLFRARLPRWAMLGIALAAYVAWYLFWIRQAPMLGKMRPLLFAQEVQEFLPRLSRYHVFSRFLFMHFSLLPWLSYTLVGAVMYRSWTRRPQSAKWWWLLALLCAATGTATLALKSIPQDYFLRSFADMMLRNMPFLFGLWMGVTLAVVLAAFRWYPGADAVRSAIGRRVSAYLEFLGRESFLFLIWHWLILRVTGLPLLALEARSEQVNLRAVAYGHWLLATVIVVLTMPWIARVGARWRARPGFVVQSGVVLALGTAPGLLAFLTLGVVRPPAMLFSFVGCLAFAFLYPELRNRLRRHFSKSATPAAP